MSVWDYPDFDDHEAVHLFTDAASGLSAIVAVHSTALGPAAGGTRFWHYADRRDAITDALRLSRGMSYKNAMAGLPSGGGKAVILADANRTKTPEMVAAFARSVNSLGGRYVTAQDVGMSAADMLAISHGTRFVSGLPVQVGAAGNLQEWLEDWGDLEPQHRHISHLYGLFPAAQITPETTPALAQAAKISLEQRGDGGTGFGLAWKAACRARLRDGEHASLCLANLVALQTCPNLFSLCFKMPQVEGAMGATAAIAEMLLQSHHGEIVLLPALPAAWHSGSVSGLRARGGFALDIAWQNGKLCGATITNLGAELRHATLRHGDNIASPVLQPGQTLRLNAELNESL